MEDTKARAHAQAKVEAEELFHKQKQVKGEREGGGKIEIMTIFTLFFSPFFYFCVSLCRHLK